MKKIIHITFICFAILFTIKSIVCQTSSFEKQFSCYEMNVNEGESEEENKKGDIKEKDVSEEGQPASSALIHSLYAISFEKNSTYDPQSHYTPYLEICSPPPELI